jgi:hypothetical protein
MLMIAPLEMGRTMVGVYRSVQTKGRSDLEAEGLAALLLYLYAAMMMPLWAVNGPGFESLGTVPESQFLTARPQDSAQDLVENKQRLPIY